MQDEYSDSRTLEAYRKRRIEELKARAATHVHGRVLPLSRADFVAEVTEGSRKCWVVVLLWKEGIEESKALQEALPHVRPRWRGGVAGVCVSPRSVPVLR